MIVNPRLLGSSLCILLGCSLPSIAEVDNTVANSIKFDARFYREYFGSAQINF